MAMTTNNKITHKKSCLKKLSGLFFLSMLGLIFMQGCAQQKKREKKQEKKRENVIVEKLRSHGEITKREVTKTRASGMKMFNGLLDLEQFWEKQAAKLPWYKKWDKVLEWREPFAHWFVGGQINASYACVDAHVEAGLNNKVAIYWEDENGDTRTYTYMELYVLVNQYAGALQKIGVKKGDIVVVYLPMIPEAVAIMLAIARLGATHSVVFSGFSAAALRDRIEDGKVKFVVTADIGFRRGKKLELKKIVDEAVAGKTSVEKVLVVKRCQDELMMVQGRDLFLHDLLDVGAVTYVEPEHVESNHPLFILYTSGTTGKPKGIMHSTGGYLTYIYSTLKTAFDVNQDSVYWCTADIGWITGHSYVTYAPLLHGLSIFMYEGAPDYPAIDQWWKMIEKYGITIFYTSPTALRMFMRHDPALIKQHDLSSLKVIGSVGEPINPEVWLWYRKYIGNDVCPVIDTWWQTETGGFMISPRAEQSIATLKPGSATLPLPGIDADVVDLEGKSVPAGTKGFLVIKKPWPGMTLGIYGDPERFKEVYWSKFKGMYYSGDYAIKDTDGYFWLLGRADEVLNIAGHRIGTAEIESAVVAHRSVAEAAAVPIADEIKGENVVVFAILKAGVNANDALKKEIIGSVRKHIGAFATPAGIYFVDKLPKTRSGKIMRRVLRAVVQGVSVGDISTLEDEASVEEVRSTMMHFKTLLQEQKL